MDFLSGIDDGEEEQAVVKVLSKLIQPQNIEMISDTNMQSNKALIQMEHFSNFLPLDNWQKIKFEYLKLCVSLQRGSRVEITNAVQKINENLIKTENIKDLLGK